MAYNFGWETTDTETFPGSGDRSLISPFTSAGAGNMSNAWVYYPPGAGSGNAKVVVYNDASGSPGTLLEASAGTSISGGGWIDCGSMSAAISASTQYWIGVVGDSYESFAEYYSYGGGYGTVRCEGLTYASPGDSPTVASTYNDVRMIIYVVVDEGGGGGDGPYAGFMTLLGI